MSKAILVTEHEETYPSSSVASKAWVRTLEVIDAPSPYYLKTGRIVGTVHTVTREQLEALFPSSQNDKDTNETR